MLIIHALLLFSFVPFCILLFLLRPIPWGALGAIANQFKAVHHDAKVVFFADTFLQGPYFIIFKLYDPPATVASEVRMILVTIDVFIVEMPILEIDLLDKAAFDEEGYSPVKGGLGDPFSLVS